MILTSLIVFALSFGVPSSSSGTYDFETHVSSTEQCPTIIYTDSNNDVYFYDTFITFTCDLKYGQESYFIYNCFFTVDATNYLLENNAYEYDAHCFASYSFDWEITQNSYQLQFSKTQFIISLYQDELTIDCKYDGVYYGNHAYTSVSGDIDNPSSLTLTIDGSYLMSVFESFVNDNMYYLGYDDGHLAGFNDGVAYADEQGSTAATIFTGICNIGLMPVNFFLGILNFEVLL